MRTHSFILILFAALLVCPLAQPLVLQAQGAPSFDAAGASAQQVASFLKTLQACVAMDNRLKVATLVEYPLQAWARGQEITVRNDSEFQARYSQIFDASLRQEIADARVDALAASREGIAIGGDRLVVRPIPDRKNALRIVAINQPAEPR